MVQARAAISVCYGNQPLPSKLQSSWRQWGMVQPTQRAFRYCPACVHQDCRIQGWHCSSPIPQVHIFFLQFDISVLQTEIYINQPYDLQTYQCQPFSGMHAYIIMAKKQRNHEEMLNMK
jgi:hypothetical protein